MRKLKTTKRAFVLLLAAVLLCVPLMGLAAPDVDAYAVKPPPCSCETKCTAAAINKDCAMCVMDRMCCTGTVPEPPCSCEVKCAEGTKNQDCLRCKDDSSHCTGKEAEPAPVCSCTVKCEAEAVKEDCPVCKDDLTGCTGKEPEPAPPVCACETKCAGDAPNGDCPVCAAYASKCQGKEPEPAPVCSCAVKCAAGAVKEDCPVCKADLTGCTGKEPQPAPVCSCTVKCAAGAVKEDCPICKADLTGCKGKAPEPTPAPKPAYTITIVAPTGWHTRTADVQIRVTDENGTGWKLVEAKIERGGSWIDLTDDFADRNRATVEITENCTVYVTVTDRDGKTHTKSRYIECFDRVAPTVKAGIDGRLLRVEAQDELSGIDAVFIDGERYSGLTNGTLDVRLRDLGGEYKQISVQAVDNAGNKSKTVQLNNPNYEEPKKDKGDKGEDKPSSSCPDASKPTTTPTPTPTPTPTTPPATTTPAPGTTTKPSTGGTGGGTSPSGGKTGTTGGTSGSKEEPPAEKEPGEALSEGSGIVTRDLLYDKATNKQFITVQGRDGNLFYIIIDYDAPVNEDEEQYTTYFLNQVDEADLAALLDDGEPAACDCTVKCAAGAVNTACPVCATNMAGCAGKAPEPEAPKETETPKPEPEPKSGTGGVLVLLLVLALAGGGAFYYVKFIKNKPKTKGSADLDDYDYGDDPEDGEYEDSPPEGAEAPDEGDAEPEEDTEDEDQ